MTASKTSKNIMIDWISFLLVGSENYSSHSSLVWLLGFGGNHSQFFFVQYCHHHIETRQIRYHSLLYRMLVELVHKGLCPVGAISWPDKHNNRTKVKKTGEWDWKYKIWGARTKPILKLYWYFHPNSNFSKIVSQKIN